MHFALDFERRDVLAPSPNGVLDPVNKIEVAVFVVAEPVAGVKPAISPCLGGGFRVLVVAMVHGPRRIGPQDELASFARSHLAIILVDHSSFDPWPRFTTGARLRWIGIRHHRR